ncbi:MAG: hypothetical protein ACI9IJ_000217 [Psychromonas sp.]|jgi:hypothetical protein
MKSLVRSFYLFVAVHSFLIGLLPIFIPIILWNKGLALNDIAYFIAFSALGFILALYFWDRLRAAANWSKIVALSFIFEILLVIILLWDFSPVLLSIGALINGAAGCFYWSTQRVLFQRITQTKNSGDSFANFQILVMVVLKLGILLGSYLLAAAQINLLLIIFLSISTFGYWLLRHSLINQIELLQPSAFSLLEVINFKDTFNSKVIFLIDGVLLFLESYFWVLSLYLLTQQNLLKLGLLIILLSVLLALIFYVIKKRIDRINTQRIFTIAVFGYACSWLLRAELSLQTGPLVLYSTVLLIAFLSSFFRLAFNKRFYDIASLAQPIQYIICKSYYSQFTLLLFFSLTGYLFSSSDKPLQQLQHLYLLIIPLVFVYLLYGRTQKIRATKLI